MDQDILDGDIGDGEDGVEDGAIAGGDAGELAAVGAFSACLSCGASVVGPFCPVCGQKNDDLRRSSFALARDFLSDTFNFDSRMWRTLGLMAIAPGLVPSNYSHGRRSLYTPPVRLFLVVSFLFFLALGLTQTMFVAFEVARKDPAQIALEKGRLSELNIELPNGQSASEVVAANNTPECQIDFGLRFFVRARDVSFDQQAWRECAASIQERAKVEIDRDDGESDAAETERARGAVNQAIGGLSAAIEDPIKFNADINVWLPRIMLGMTPVLALLLSLFIRGRDALFFDHLVLAFYSHAVGFAIVGAAVILTQLGVKAAGAVAVLALVVYFVAAVKRAYKRGWVKTLFAAAFVSFFYFVILSSIVFAIVSNQVWRAGA